MEKTYMTKLVGEGTNLSFTVPLPLILTTKTRHRTPWRWTDTTDNGQLLIVPYQGTVTQARKRNAIKHDIVFLQRMKRSNGSCQYKLNLPRWIYEDKDLDKIDESQIVKIEWVRTSDNKINGRVVVVDDEPS